MIIILLLFACLPALYIIDYSRSIIMYLPLSCTLYYKRITRADHVCCRLLLAYQFLNFKLAVCLVIDTKMWLHIYIFVWR